VIAWIRLTAVTNSQDERAPEHVGNNEEGDHEIARRERNDRAGSDFRERTPSRGARRAEGGSVIALLEPRVSSRAREADSPSEGISSESRIAARLMSELGRGWNVGSPRRSHLR